MIASWLRDRGFQVGDVQVVPDGIAAARPGIPGVPESVGVDDDGARGSGTAVQPRLLLEARGRAAELVEHQQQAAPCRRRVRRREDAVAALRPGIREGDDPHG